MGLRLFTADGREKIQAKGEDQLFSFKGVLAEAEGTTPSADDGYIESDAVPEGEIWVVTNVVVRDGDRGLTCVDFAVYRDTAYRYFHSVTAAIAAGQRVPWSGHVYLDYQDVIRCYLIGSLDADNCAIWLTGYRMTKES